MNISTASANSNIAIIKYWGNSDDKLIIPSNNSLSFTMDDQLQTRTTVMIDDDFSVDELWINDQKASEQETLRVSQFLNLFRKKSKKNYKAKVYSENSFPKGAGMASSASAFAALAGACSKAFKLDLNEKQLSSIARFGSGSASRSLFGGAVEWKKGNKKDGSDCFSEQIVPKQKLKKLRNVIAVIEKGEKEIGSRKGMQITTKTSPNFNQRLMEVENRLKNAKNAILDFDFQKLAPIIMQDSDSMHQVMKESSPSLIYMNKISEKIKQKIIQLNKENGSYLGAYTFDAGPNAHTYTLDSNVQKIKSALKEIKEVKEIIVCSIGDGIKYSNSHLM